jgi:hypothetical protein
MTLESSQRGTLCESMGVGTWAVHRGGEVYMDYVGVQVLHIRNTGIWYKLSFEGVFTEFVKKGKGLLLCILLFVVV